MGRVDPALSFRSLPHAQTGPSPARSLLLPLPQPGLSPSLSSFLPLQS